MPKSGLSAAASAPLDPSKTAIPRIAYVIKADPTWPTNVAAHQTAAPWSRMTAKETSAVSAIWGAATPSTTSPLVSRRQSCPWAIASALASRGSSSA